METVHAIHTAGGHALAPGIPRRDDEPFEAILLAYSPVLYRIALRKLGNAEDAEDALQDALLSAFKNMHKFRGEARFSTWLGSIVLNSARMQLRRRLTHNLVSLDQRDENHGEGKRVWAERLEDGPELADLTIYVIDVAEGEKIPRKGGPGITRSDLLVINKIDLAPFVGANLAVMEADTLRMRVKRPFVFTNLRSGEGVEQIASFIIENGGLAKAAA